MKKQFEVPKVESKSQDEIDAIIDAINKCNLPENIKPFLINCIRLACWFPSLLQKQHITMRKLREMIFGKGKKRKKSGGNGDGNTSSGDSGENNGNPSTATSNKTEDNSSNDDNSETGTTENNKQVAKPKKGKNNGRNPHTIYEDAEIIWHRLIDIKPGSPCPEDLCTGKLSALPAGVIVVVDGQPMAKVTKHFVEKYRCGLCGYRVEAKVPEELEGKQKVYTPELKTHLALHKFFLAVPYHRMDTYQKMLNVPLPDSTQWNLIESVASCCYPVLTILKFWQRTVKSFGTMIPSIAF